ncbi:MAG: hypothetical protein M1455_10085 [Actinobacteria bacterium]|nr:hypothetical protein [Actinomycetota bacterium]
MEMILAILAAVILTLILTFLRYWMHWKQRNDEKTEAVAALRFELQTNLGWLDDVLEAHILLNDEAWVILKNKGYISYLPAPIPRRVISIYDMVHRLNEQIGVLNEKNRSIYKSRGEQREDRDVLRDEINELITLLDTRFPKIGRNFEV